MYRNIDEVSVIVINVKKLKKKKIQTKKTYICFNEKEN